MDFVPMFGEGFDRIGSGQQFTVDVDSPFLI